MAYLALWSASYFSAKGGSASGGNNNKWGYVRFAIIGTLFFDAVTGLLIGPLFFHQSFLSTLIGQIPFTALHCSVILFLPLFFLRYLRFFD